jgi:outer membrane protein OmpA-like peptidoglycan-associated protein/uncharacterized protein YegL
MIVFARVMDSAGNFVTHLANPYYDATNSYKDVWSGIREKLAYDTVDITEFSVREYGEKDSLPVSIVLALDHGGSMQGAIQGLQDGTELFVSLKRPQDNIGIVKFDNKAVIEVPLTNDKSEIQRKFKKNGLEGFGLYTAANDATLTAFDVLSKADSSQPRILILFSDGEDNDSKAQKIDVFNRAKELKAHIFTIAFGYANDTTLREYAEFTGGKFYKAYSREELIAVFEDIYRSLRNFYRVSYVPPTYGGVHDVEVNLTLQGRSDTLQALTQYDMSHLRPDISKFFENIYFAYNKATIQPQSFEILDRIATAMKRYPRAKVEIRGHTDNIGGEEFNQKLSEERAKAVLEALIQRGITSNRLRSRGFGLTQPIASNDTDEGRKQNRRTEFIVIAR